jgi:rubrerythrin
MILNKFPRRRAHSGHPRPANWKCEMMPSDPSILEKNYFYNAPADQTEILWKCLGCGLLKPRSSWGLSPCPSCGAPVSQFVLVDED